MVHDGTGRTAAAGHTRGEVRQTRKAFEARSAHASTPSKDRRTRKPTGPCKRNTAIETIPQATRIRPVRARAPMRTGGGLLGTSKGEYRGKNIPAPSPQTASPGPRSSSIWGAANPALALSGNATTYRTNTNGMRRRVIFTDAALPTAPCYPPEPPCPPRDVDDRRRAGNHGARTGPPAS